MWRDVRQKRRPCCTDAAACTHTSPQECRGCCLRQVKLLRKNRIRCECVCVEREKEKERERERERERDA
jgi:hypothetical protein